MVNPQDALVLLQSWAAATTDNWFKEVQQELARQKRIQTSIRFRARKKQELAQLRQDRDRLEAEVKRRLEAIEIVVRRDKPSWTIQDEIISAICRLALESDSFRTQNLKLQQKLRLFERFVSIMGGDLDTILPIPSPDCSALNVRDASKTSPWVAHALRNEPGWCVYFPRHEPSFYFHPFSRAEFDSSLKVCDTMLAVNLPSSSIQGTLFGWTVRHAQLLRQEDNSLLAHARFTTRVCCSLDDADAIITSGAINAVCVLIIPSDGKRTQRDLVSMQVLQEFDRDSYVMVCNIPGQVHTRFFQVARRQPVIDSNGRRSITYSLVVADSETNQRNRAAEAPQPDVQWVNNNEAGVCMKVEEVNETTIDVSNNHWAGCSSQEHAKHYYLLWGEYACRWLQSCGESMRARGYNSYHHRFVAPPNQLDTD